MSLHAVDDIDDAFEATKALLLPFDWGQWLGLTVIALFLGGSTANFPTGDISGVGMPAERFRGPGGVGQLLPEMSPSLLATVFVAVLVFVVVGLLFAVAGAVMEFALIESLSRGEVHVRRYARRHLGNGLRLFGFRIGLGLVALIVLATLLGGLVLALGGPAALDSIWTLAVLFAVGLPILLFVGLVYAVISGFTTTFVVPVVIRTDRTVLGAWRRFWRPLREEWTEYLVYAGFVVVLQLVAGMVLGVILGMVGAILFVPLGIVGVVGLVGLGGASPAALLALVVVGGLLFVVFLAIAAFIRVPVIAFFRYYALLVLGDTDPELDLIPDLRREIRGASDDSNGPQTTS